MCLYVTLWVGLNYTETSESGNAGNAQYMWAAPDPQAQPLKQYNNAQAWV